MDILYFHAFDPITPVEESLEAIEDLVQRDLIRYFAVSNFSAEQLRRYQEVGKTISNRARILAVQNQFDILNGESEKHAGVLDFCAKNDISFVAWSPLARGLLTDRYLDPAKVKTGDRLFDEGTLANDTGLETMKKLSQLAELAKQWDISMSQLSLAYMLSLPGMGPAIPSSSTVEQLESNAAAGKIELTDEQKEAVFRIVG